MSFVQMLVDRGFYIQNGLDQDNNGINEFTQTENEDGLIKFQSFDFDQNGAIDYTRCYSYTADGKKVCEEFYTNSEENNEKIYQKKSVLDKVLNFLGFETQTTLDDINKEEIRAKADELTEQYANANDQSKQEKAEKSAIQNAQLKEMQIKIEEAREMMKKSIDFQDTLFGTKEEKDEFIEDINTFN